MASARAQASAHRDILRLAAVSVVESLERRQMFAVAPAQIGINYAPWATEAETGYLTDSGEVYGTQQFGFDYGWQSAITSGNTYERSASKPQKLETGVVTTTTNSWKIKLEPGVYVVKLVAGDANITSGTYKYNINGTTNFLNGTAGSGDARWVSATGEVTVGTDGTDPVTNEPFGWLIITDNGGTQHRLAHVDIVRKDAKDATGNPAAPTDVVATARLSTWVDIRWVDSSAENFDDGFQIERKTIVNGSVTATATITEGGGIRQLYADYTRSASTTYEYRVRAVRTTTGGSVRYSTWSSPVQVTTPANDNQSVYGPANWSVPTVNSSTGLVEPLQAEDYDKGGPGAAYGDSVGSNAGGFYRGGSVDVGLFAPENTYFVGWVDTNDWQEYTANIATAGTYYVDAMVASNGAGGTWKLQQNGSDKITGIQVKDTGGWHQFEWQSSDTFSLTSGNGQVLRFWATAKDTSGKFVGNFDSFRILRFDAPTSLSATAVSSGQINLSWTSNATAPDIYWIDRKQGVNGTWTHIASVGGSNSAYTDTDGSLQAGETYYYRVRARREILGAATTTYGDTSYSNESNATLPNPMQAPSAPTGLTGSTSGTTVTLSWTDTSSTETGFYILRKLASESWPANPVPAYASVAANITSYSDTNTASATNYHYKVVAYNAAGRSSDSNQISVTTSSSQVTTLNPTADTYVRDGSTYSSTSFGTQGTVEAKAGSGFTRQAFLKFDLTGLSGTVNDAVLRVYGKLNTADNVPIVAKEVTDNTWTESINWSTKPAMGTTIDQQTITGTSNTWHEFDLTPYVTTAIAANQTTLTVGLTGINGTSAYLSFTSREDPGNTGNKPRLVVTTTTTGPQAPADPTGLGRVVPPDSSVTIGWTDTATNETAYEVQRKTGAGAWSTQTSSLAANSAQYPDPSYLASSDQTYRVRALNDTIASGWSNELAIPAQPNQPTLGAVTTTSVALSWNDPSSVETNYRVERRLTGGTWTTLTTLAAGTTSHTDGTVVDGASYEYRVRAINGSNDGLASASISVTVPLKAPTGLTAGTVVAKSATTADVPLTWTDVSTNNTGYQLQRRPAGGSWSTLPVSLSGTATSHTDATAVPGTTYEYQVRATNGTPAAASAFSTVPTSIVTPPATPSGLAFTATTATSVTLVWGDVATETGYKVERRVTGTIPYSEIASTLAAGTTTYTDTTATEGTQYDYRVRAFNATGDGWATNPVQPWTKLAAPTGVAATAAASSAITVTWTDNTTLETGYAIDYSTSPTFASGVTTTTAAANASSKLLNGLTAGTTYYVRVRATNASTASVDSASASAATLGALGITRSPSGSTNEGTQITLTPAYASGTAVSGTTYAWTVTKNGNAFAADSGATFSFTPDDNASYAASLVATTPSGVNDVGTLASFGVANVSPTLTATGASTAAVGQTYTLELDATDPGSADTITWSIDWGDGTTTEPTGRDLQATHTYSAVGNYTVSISATDGTTSATPSPSTLTVTVTAGTFANMTNFSVAANVQNALDLSWTDNSTTEIGYVLNYYGHGIPQGTFNPEWEHHSVFMPANAGNAGSYRLTGLAAGYPYALSLTALGPNGTTTQPATASWVYVLSRPTNHTPIQQYKLGYPQVGGPGLDPYYLASDYITSATGVTGTWSDAPATSTTGTYLPARTFQNEGVSLEIAGLPRHRYLLLPFFANTQDGWWDDDNLPGEVSVELNGVPLEVEGTMTGDAAQWTLGSNTGPSIYDYHVLPHTSSTATIAVEGSDFQGVSNWWLGGLAAYTILPTVSIQTDNWHVDEGASESARIITYTVERQWFANDAPSDDMIVSLDWSASTTSSSDLLASLPTQVTIPGGSKTTTFTVTIADDQLLESEERLFASIAVPTDATYEWNGRYAMTWIADNESADWDADSDNNDKDGVPAHTVDEENVEEGPNGKWIATSAGLPEAKRKFVPLKLDPNKNAANGGTRYSFAVTSGLRLWKVQYGNQITSGSQIVPGQGYTLQELNNGTIYVEATGSSFDTVSVSVVGSSAQPDVIAFNSLCPRGDGSCFTGVQQDGTVKTNESDISGQILSPTRTGDGTGEGYEAGVEAELRLCGNAIAIVEGQSVRIYDGNALTPRIPGQGHLRAVSGGFTETLADGRTLFFAVPSASSGTVAPRSRLGGFAVQQSGLPGGDTYERVYGTNGKLSYEYATRGNYTEKATYEYDGSDRVTKITLTGQHGSAEAQVIRYVAYSYYTTGEAGGYGGALKKAVLYDRNDLAIQTKYYRYYVGGETGGYAGKLKYVFGTEGYARLIAAGLSEGSSDSAAAAYADDFFVYDSTSGRVTQHSASGTGCSVCSGGIGGTEYTYATSANASGYNSWTFKRTQELDDGTIKTTYSNFAQQPMLEVVTDGSKTWRTYYRYGSDGQLVMTANPSAVTGHDEVLADLVGASTDFAINLSAGTVAGDLYYINDTAGLIQYSEVYAADETTSGAAPGYQKASYIQRGENGSLFRQSFTTYTGVTVNDVTTYFVDTSTVYRDTATAPSDGLVTDYDYAFHAGTAQIKLRTTNQPIVLDSQNGSNAQIATLEYYDLEGRLLWTKDGSGFINGYTYNDDGSLNASIVDVDTSLVSGEPSGWTTPSTGGLHIETTYTTDDLGRTTKVVDPNGNVTYTVYDDVAHEVRTYRGWSNGAPTGPVEVSRDDRARNYSEYLTYTFSGTYPVDSNGVPTGDESLTSGSTTIHSLSRSIRNTAGQTVESVQYFNLVGTAYSPSTAKFGTANTNYYATRYAYDKQGRQNRVENPNGTITRMEYNGAGQMLSTWVGTDDQPDTGFWSTSNLTGTNMVKVSENQYDGGTAAGDGLVTASIAYPGGTSDPRVTNYFYDWRNRLVATKGGVQNNENSTTSVQRQIVYSDLNNLGEQLATYVYDGDNVDITDANNDGTPDKPSNSLLRAKSVNEYDNLSRVFRSTTYAVNPTSGDVASTGLVSQSWFDNRGQVIKSTSSGSATQKMLYDSLGRVEKSYVTNGGGDSTYADADDVTGDTVLEQVEYTYDDNGNVIQTTARQRFHNASGTGELGSPSSGIGARVSYATRYYDKLDRLTDSVNVGTNGGVAYTRPGSAPARSDTVLRTSYVYDAAGRLQSVTDPKNIVARTEYDALGRTTRTIEAYTNGTPTDDTNRITAYTYDGLGNVTSLKAVLPDGPDAGIELDVQETKYLYGATTTRGDGLNSNDVLIAVRYPDKSNGSASPTEQEAFKTNALGQVIETLDRNGNVHAFTYDVMGRLTSDAVTTLGSGVDGAVRRIATTYNTQGLVEKITSYDAPTYGNVVNEVQRTYNGLGQLTIEYQAHDGAVNTSTTPKVQYGYATVENGSRLTLMTYPNGRELVYSYASGLDSTISRLSSIEDGAETLEEYAYLGLSGVVMRMHPENGVDLTYVGSPGDAGDQYAGLDRFGRVVDHKWTDGSSAVDQYLYAYDRNSNRISKDNLLNPAFNEDYTYDNLNRLTDTNRNSADYQAWDLDALGNSNSVTTSGVTQNRTHNSQNQLTGMGSNSLAFDANGNTTTDQNGRTLVYDAWNRLVEAKSGSTSLIRYEYDGLTRRIEEGAADQFFSAAWQVLEERVAGAVTASYAWSPVYVDAMIARDRNTSGDDSVLEERLYALQDANFNVTAIADASGDIVERYLFDPYGKRIVLDPNFSADADNASDFAFMHGHQGGKYDSVLTNQMLFRNRVYDVETMRWMQQDPAGYVDGASLYTSYNASPLIARDPAGLQSDLDGDGTPDSEDDEADDNDIEDEYAKAAARATMGGGGLKGVSPSQARGSGPYVQQNIIVSGGNCIVSLGRTGAFSTSTVTNAGVRFGLRVGSMLGGSGGAIKAGGNRAISGGVKVGVSASSRSGGANVAVPIRNVSTVGTIRIDDIRAIDAARTAALNAPAGSNGAAAAYVAPSGKIYTGYSTGIYNRAGQTRGPIHEAVSKAYSLVPAQSQFHMKCAETEALSNARMAGESLSGGTLAAVKIGGLSNMQTKQPCDSCGSVASLLGLRFAPIPKGNK